MLSIGVGRRFGSRSGKASSYDIVGVYAHCMYEPSSAAYVSGWQYVGQRLTLEKEGLTIQSPTWLSGPYSWANAYVAAMGLP